MSLIRTDEMLIIVPFFRFAISRAAAWVRRNGPLRFTAITASNSFSGWSLFGHRPASASAKVVRW